MSDRARPHLRVIEGELEAVPWSWFCGHCAAPSPHGAPPPSARVCSSCGMGVLLEARADAVPEPDAAFLVVDHRLVVQGLSRQAESFLAVSEEQAVGRPVTELLAPADAEAGAPGSFGALIVDAVGNENAPRRAFVRPTETFGVRIRARVAACGPPRAALVVLESPRRRQLRAV